MCEKERQASLHACGGSEDSCVGSRTMAPLSRTARQHLPPPLQQFTAGRAHTLPVQTCAYACMHACMHACVCRPHCGCIRSRRWWPPTATQCFPSQMRAVAAPSRCLMHDTRRCPAPSSAFPGALTYLDKRL